MTKQNGFFHHILDYFNLFIIFLNSQFYLTTMGSRLYDEFMKKLKVPPVRRYAKRIGTKD